MFSFTSWESFPRVLRPFFQWRNRKIAFLDIFTFQIVYLICKNVSKLYVDYICI